jgi:two-component sensor histidine kinase
MRQWWASGRTRHERRARAVVLAGLGVFVVGTYVVVVLGGGALVGQTDSPSLGLSVLATAVVALGFEPVQARLEAAATRLVRGGTPSPYDVLSRFSETVTGGYATEELPGRMAMLLGQGTGAEWAQVWLTVQDRLTLAATWPPDAAADEQPPDPVEAARDATGPGRRALSVRHGGQVLGVFRLQEPAGEPLTTVEERLFTGLAAQAGLVLRLVGLRAELAARHGDLLVRAAELRASRERLIETQDAERRRLERDIHDGAQQHLVALAVNLRLAETVAARSPERAARVLAEQAEAAREAIEAALYFFAMEAVQNAAKHARASAITVTFRRAGQDRVLSVVDDGAGFDAQRAEQVRGGAGLANMRDRLDAVGGSVSLMSAPGRGTSVVAVVGAAQ